MNLFDIYVLDDDLFYLNYLSYYIYYIKKK
jgi:hypothetical protein